MSVCVLPIDVCQSVFAEVQPLGSALSFSKCVFVRGRTPRGCGPSARGETHGSVHVSPLIRGKVVFDQWPLLGCVRSGAADSR